VPGVDLTVGGGLVESWTIEWQCSQEHSADRFLDPPARDQWRVCTVNESGRSSCTDSIHKCATSDYCCTGA
ncbi:MAG: hypothetical protein WCP55_21770, partial [Lentisphaerota bacterium]